MRILLVWIFCHLAAAAAMPAFWQGAANGYAGDSFWTLSVPGRIGVATISISGLLILAAVNNWKTQAILRWSRYRWRVPVWLLDVALSLALFALLFSISPQIYYSFYQQIIAGLPNQWVIDGPFNWDRLRDIALPRSGASLADHTGAIAIGGLILFTAYLHRRQIS